MSRKGDSPGDDEAKQSARFNIIQAINTAHATSPPTTPTQSSQQPSPVSVEDIAKERQVHVLGMVKAFHLDVNTSPLLLPKPRSPRHSPTCNSPIQQKKAGDISPAKALPQRPPPPKLSPRTKGIAQSDSNSSPDQLMRRRSIDMDKSLQKPKPPIRARTRKKKFAPTEDSKLATNQNESSSSDIVQSEVTSDAVSAVEDMDGMKDTAQGSKLLEVKEEAEEEDYEIMEPIKGDSEVKETDLYKDDWEVIPDSATTESRLDTEESCLYSNGDTSKIENALKSMSVKKKRPPPFRPPPYTAKIPPLPPKKKKIPSPQLAAKWNQLAEEVSSATLKQVSHQEAENESQSQESQNLAVEADEKHLYEDIGALTADVDSEVSIHLLSRPELMLDKRTTSFSSMESDQSEMVGDGNGTFLNTGTLGEGVVQRQDKVNKSTRSVRPKSAVPLTGSYKELETSFEVIPQVGSDLDTVMSSLRQTDEKYQDASVYDLIQACSKALPHITSTSELPVRLPDFPDSSRALVIHELYTTEYTYVKGLEVLCEVFRDALNPIIGEETSYVFANVDDILSFNKSFLALLHSRLRELGPDARIGDLFIGMFTQAHKSMYAIYCSNYDSAERHVTRLRKRKDFELALLNCFSNNRVMPGLTLPAYLITPVQRIPRYILLLKDIIKHTSEGHPERKSLLKAQEIMGELADFIDAQVRESQTKKTFDALKDKVHGLADLDSPNRSLVKEGQVYLKNIKKLYQCILFNDLLVFAHGDSKQSKVELQLDLEAVWFEDLEDLDPQTSEEDAIEIYTPERPYTIYTRSSSEKRLWLSRLRDTIYQYLLKLEKCEKSKFCTTESRYASFVYSDGRTYNGNFIDSRRHGKGTMTWPNKTIYVGDWIDDDRCGEGEFTYNTGEVYRGRWSEDKQNGYGELQFTSNDIYRGHWKDGVKHGSGKIIYANGDKFEGHFSSGQIEEKGKLTCVNGAMYDGEWKHSQRHGKGKLITSTKNHYDGEFQYNQMHGQGTMVYESKDVYKGGWKNGMRSGRGKFTSKLEGTYDGLWEDDLRHGTGKQIYPNGDEYDGGWEHNMRHVHGKIKFSTGVIYEGDIKYDIIHGEGEMRYSSTSKYQGSWVNGQRHGLGAMVYSDNSSYNGDWQYGMRHGFGEYVMSDGSIYKGYWAYDKTNGKGTLSIPYISYTYSGDWVCGKREGRGEEASHYGRYKGSWRGDLKHGYGEERSLVGTIFVGSWEKGKKNGRGNRKMIFGAVDDQIWKSGQLMSDTHRMTAVDLPYISRNDL